MKTSFIALTVFALYVSSVASFSNAFALFLDSENTAFLDSENTAFLDSENTALLDSFDSESTLFLDSESTLFLDSDSENTVFLDSRVDNGKKFFAGQTQSSDWTAYGGTAGLQVTVDICEFGLKNPPIVITSVAGKSNHWTLTGTSSVYNVTPKGFTVYIRNSNGAGLSSATAVANGWVLNYVIISQD